MINSRDNNKLEHGSVYNILYYVGECLENKKNSKELIKILGYFIDKTGVVVYINHNIYSSNIDDCEIIKLEELNENWVKTSKIVMINISSTSKTNIGLSNMLNESCGHLEITDKGVALVRKKD